MCPYAGIRNMDIELRHIHKSFGPVHANNDINVTFRGGQVVGVLGENGAGKSTLMKILSGFQPADSGEIVINGQPQRYDGPEAAIAHGVGMLQQDPLDVLAFTVLENFMFGLPFSRKAARAKLLEISRQFGFELDPDTPNSQLTIAQRQQLEIVRLLALNVKALILDEPTTGISAEQKSLLFNTLRELAREGLTVLLVSHKLEDVIALCDEVIVLRSGQVVGAAEMPLTHQELVTMMFGQELEMPTRERIDLDKAEEVLLLDSICVHGKRVEIEFFSLNVRAGEVIGLAGLDESGQEMLMRATAGLLPCFHGRIQVGSQDLTGKPYREYLSNGVVFGAAGRLEEGLITGLTLTEHMALVSDKSTMVDWRRVRNLTAEKIGLYNVRGQPQSEIQTLSGGNQQRVLMALLPETPRVMILEQPTRGLDVESSQWIWEQLMRRRAQGTAIIFSSAELDEILTYSDRILVFYAGRVFEIPDATQTTVDELGHLIGGHFEERAS